MDTAHNLFFPLVLDWLIKLTTNPNNYQSKWQDKGVFILQQYSVRPNKQIASIVPKIMAEVDNSPDDLIGTFRLAGRTTKVTQKLLRLDYWLSGNECQISNWYPSIARILKKIGYPLNTTLLYRLSNRKFYHPEVIKEDLNLSNLFEEIYNIGEWIYTVENPLTWRDVVDRYPNFTIDGTVVELNRLRIWPVQLPAEYVITGSIDRDKQLFTSDDSRILNQGLQQRSIVKYRLVEPVTLYHINIPALIYGMGLNGFDLDQSLLELLNIPGLLDANMVIPISRLGKMKPIS